MNNHYQQNSAYSQVTAIGGAFLFLLLQLCGRYYKMKAEVVEDTEKAKERSAENGAEKENVWRDRPPVQYN